VPTSFRGRASYGSCKLHAKTCRKQLFRVVDVFILRVQAQEAFAALGPIDKAVLRLRITYVLHCYDLFSDVFSI